MNWRSPEDELPKGQKSKSIRCIAIILVEKESWTWSGLSDVYFRADSGWFKCEDNSHKFSVLQWIYFDELGWHE